MVNYADKAKFDLDSLDKQISIVSSDSTISITNSDIVGESFTLTESLCSEDNLTFGATEPGCIKFTVKNTFPNMMKKWLTVSITPNGASTALVIGEYRVWSDKPSSDRSTREITAYDILYKILKSTYKKWYNEVWGSSDSMTIKEFRDAWFSRLSQTHSRISQESTTLVNDNVILKKSKNIQKPSGKDIFNAICEVNGVFGHIGRDGVFHYIQLSSSVSPTDISKRLTISVDYEDYSVETVDRVEVLSQDGELLGSAGESENEALNTYTIRNNFMLKGLGNDDNAKTTADYIATSVLGIAQGFTFVPFDAEFKGNPCFEVGDEILFHAHNTDIHSFILTRTMKGIQSLHDNFSADGEETYPQDKNTFSSKIEKLNDSISNVDANLETLDYKVDNMPYPDAGYAVPSDGKNGDVYVLTTPPIKIERHINNSPYWYATQLVQKSSGKYDITVTGYSDPAITPATADAPVKFKAIGFGGAGTYHIKCKMQFTGYSGGNAWNCNNLGLYLSYDDTGIYFGQTMSYGTLSATPYNTFLLNTFFDNNEHEYSFDFTIDSSHGGQIVNKTMYLAVVMDRCWKYGDPMASGTLTITDLEITGQNVSSETEIIGMQANINGSWKNIDYVNDVSQTQSSTGGTEIAEIQNTNGTKTKIYQKTVDPNPTGTPTETLSSIAIGDTLYELGGASAVSDLTDVDLTSLSDGQILKYSSANQKWENANESGGGGSAEMLAPTPFIYSEDEEQVGIWSDGKPIYQKIYYFDSSLLLNSNTWTSTTISNSTIERIIDVRGFNDLGAIYDFIAANRDSGSYIQILQTRNSAIAVNGIILQYTKTTDTAWQGGFKAYGFTPVIYSDTEREIGVWIDGKPLYAKTINVAPLPNNTDKRVAHGISNLDKFISAYGYATAPNVNSTPLPFVNATSISAQVGIITDTSDVIIRARDDRSSYTNAYVTLYYTKTTDTAGSGKYTTLGTPAVHYDGEERVIGTWFGETLYEKSWEFDSYILISANAITSLASKGVTLSNVDFIVDNKLISAVDKRVYNGYSVGYFSGNIGVYNPTSADMAIDKVVLQYTKTS